jgi:pyruvate formate lyase activating enzyme
MIAGIQKLTLLDFPGHTACTVFLAGCNMRCPFCHNAELFGGKVEEVMSTDEFLKFLSTRQGLLDGVCVSGGEPTGDPQLPQLLRAIKDLGFQVKLDTNGSRPEILKKLLEENLVDYVAMDVKNSPSRYSQTIGLETFDLTPIEESLRLLLTGNTPYELRTTVVQQLHDEASIEEMGRWLSTLVPGVLPKKLFLQKFVDRDTVAFSGLCAPEENALKRFVDTLTPYVEKIAIRGG